MSWLLAENIAYRQKNCDALGLSSVNEASCPLFAGEPSARFARFQAGSQRKESVPPYPRRSLSLSNARRRNHARRGEEAQGARAGGSNCLYWPTGASSCKPVAAERFALGFLQLRFCHLALKGVLSRAVWNRTRRLRPSKGFALDPPLVENCKACVLQFCLINFISARSLSHERPRRQEL